MSPSPRIRSAHRLRLPVVAFLIALFAVNVYRAATQSVTADEAYAYQLLVRDGPRTLVDRYDACHHVLHTWLTFFSTRLFGLSDFTLRIPSLLGGALYLYAAYRLIRRWFGENWMGLLLLAWLVLNPLILDYLSAARGYGMGLAFLLLAFAFHSEGRLTAAGVASGLAVASNLTMAFPITAFATVICLRERLWDWVDRFAGPAVVTAFVVVVLPLSHAGKEHFYYGAKTWAETLETLTFGALFYHFPCILASNWHDSYFHLLVRFAQALPWLLGLLGLAAAWLGRRTGHWTWIATLAGTVALLVAGHSGLGILLPRFRTGLYLYPLAGLVVMTFVFLAWQRGKAWRAAAALAATGMAAQVVIFASCFEWRSYSEYRYDSATKRVAEEIIRRHEGGKKVRAGASSINSVTLDYYRLRYKLDWMEPVEWKPPEGNYDFYVLQPADHGLVKSRNLRVLMLDAESGLLLAAPSK